MVFADQRNARYPMGAALFQKSEAPIGRCHIVMHKYRPIVRGRVAGAANWSLRKTDLGNSGIGHGKAERDRGAEGGFAPQLSSYFSFLSFFPATSNYTWALHSETRRRTRRGRGVARTGLGDEGERSREIAGDPRRGRTESRTLGAKTRRPRSAKGAGP